MTGTMLAIVGMAALFAVFGLMRHAAGGGGACEGCPGGCGQCAAVTGEDRVEVPRGRT